MNEAIHVHKLLGTVHVQEKWFFLPCGCFQIGHRTVRVGPDAEGSWSTTYGEWQKSAVLNFGECKGPKVIAA